MSTQPVRWPRPDAPAAPSLSPFTHRAFALFWAAHLFSALAVQAESVTIGWQVYTVARHVRSVEQSAFLVGMVGLAQFVPLFLLTPIAGATADRCSRRSILLACMGAEIGCVLALAALSLEPSPSFVSIFAIAAAFGASRAFLSPASAAMGPMLVHRRALPSPFRATRWATRPVP